MTEGDSEKNWFATLPGILASIAAFLTAVTAFVGALTGAFSTFWPHSAATKASGCLPGYTWRLIVPDDHVCVSEASHRQAEVDNQLAGSRRNPAGGAFGADTCQTGFVWREAFPEDKVCVIPEIRKQTQQDNAQAALRVTH